MLGFCQLAANGFKLPLAMHKDPLETSLSAGPSLQGKSTPVYKHPHPHSLHADDSPRWQVLGSNALPNEPAMHGRRLSSALPGPNGAAEPTIWLAEMTPAVLTRKPTPVALWPTEHHEGLMTTLPDQLDGKQTNHPEGEPGI